MKLGLFRVAQPALSNIVGYANANRAVLRLWTGRDPRTLQLSVEDDGRGFVPESSVRGLGFDTMEGYLGAIGGSYTLQSSPGNGTTITATVPWDARRSRELGDPAVVSPSPVSSVG